MDILGNWSSVKTNADGSGQYATTETRTHNDVNELLGRTINGGAELTSTYDDAGNAKERGLTATTKFVYTVDGWNRLVKVEYHDGSNLVPRGVYKYNGLHWRVRKQADASAAADGVLDQQRVMYYTADAGGWRLIQEEINDNLDVDGTDDRRMTMFYGIRGVDDIAMRRQTTLSDGATTDFFHLTDPLFSTVAVLNASGVVQERVEYTAYGFARHHRAADITGDGGVNTSDLLAVIGNWGNFGKGDLSRDGTVNTTDLLLVISNWSEPSGRITSPGNDNIFGYAGMVFNPESMLYLARHRWYDPELGRFISRDPAGYIDGMLLYAYVSGNPLVLVDPLGLVWWNPWSWGCEDAQWKESVDESRKLQLELIERMLQEGKITLEEANRLRVRVNDWADDGKIAVQQAEDDSKLQTLETARDAAVAVGTAPVGGAVIGGLVKTAGKVKNVVAGAKAVDDGASAGKNAYSTFSEQAVSGTTRQAHRTAANRQLYKQLEADPALRAMYNRGFGTDVMAHMRSGKSGLLNPPGTVWHHPVQTGGVVHLVPRAQHVSPAFQPILHPGGVGGFALWW